MGGAGGKIFKLAGLKVYVAGHRGMAGSALVRRLGREDCEILSADHDSLDLRRQADVETWFAAQRPDVVILAAGTVGGILANATRPAEFIFDNLAIETNVINAAHRTGVSKLLFLGSSCIYPREASQPIDEDQLLAGPLEPTNQWYAIAKIAGIKMAEAYRAQYGADFVSVMPTNLYGPGDNFSLASAHVLPALMRKAYEARESGAETLAVWGSGRPRREFLFVDDFADACVFVLKNYSGAPFLNVGTGEDIAIRELAERIAAVTGFTGGLNFDASKPDGMLRKQLDVSRLAELGWTASTRLENGLEQTYRWFAANLATLRR